VFDGGYQDFLEKGGWGDAAAMTRHRDDAAELPMPAAPRLTKKDLRRLRSEIVTEKSRVLKPVEDQIAAAESDIEKNEAALEQLTQEMAAVSQEGDGARIGPLSQRIRACEQIIESRFAEMEAMDDQRRRLEKKFEKRLAELDG
jgi:ATP-binding cassette subfamily F protein 3